MVSVSVRSLFHQPMDEKIKTWPLCFPAKETLIWRRHCSIGQFSRKFSGMKFFHLSVRLTSEKPDAFVCPFDKPIKLLYFRSFVVSVLFASFRFKVIRKSLYTSNECNTFSKKTFGIFCQFTSSSSCNFMRITRNIFLEYEFFFPNKKQNESLI